MYLFHFFKYMNNPVRFFLLFFRPEIKNGIDVFPKESNLADIPDSNY